MIYEYVFVCVTIPSPQNILLRNIQEIQLLHSKHKISHLWFKVIPNFIRLSTSPFFRWQSIRRGKQLCNIRSGFLVRAELIFIGYISRSHRQRNKEKEKNVNASHTHTHTHTHTHIYICVCVCVKWKRSHLLLSEFILFYCYSIRASDTLVFL